MDIKLSDRLSALTALVPPGVRLADIGCDHAYIPVVLCLDGTIPSAVAMDLKEGPLERAREHISDHCLDDRIETRLSDGLAGLGDDEADTVLISGMGGLLIKRILTERNIPESVTDLILQPQSDIAEVRRCVRELGFWIADEDMVLEDGKFYPMMRAVRVREGEESFRDSRRGRQAGADDDRDTEAEDAFGPVLLNSRHPVLHEWLDRELDTTDRILAHLEAESGRRPSPGSEGESGRKPSPESESESGRKPFPGSGSEDGASEKIMSRLRELEHYRELLLNALDRY